MTPTPFLHPPIYYNFSYMSVCAFQWVCAPKYRYLWESEEGIRPPKAAVPGSCELINVGAGRQIWVFGKNSKYS